MYSFLSKISALGGFQREREREREVGYYLGVFEAASLDVTNSKRPKRFSLSLSFSLQYLYQYTPIKL